MGVSVIKRIEPIAPRVKKALPPLMPRIALYLQSCADKKIKNGVKPENAPLTKEVKRGDKTLRDTGILAASIAPHNGKLWADASTNMRYARILQEGGTISGKKSGLWIPASARTRSLFRQYGVTKPKELIPAMRADGYTMYFSKSKKTFMAKKGSRGKEFALFIVRKSVKIPARPFLYISESEELFIMNMVCGRVATSIKDGKKA